MSLTFASQKCDCCGGALEYDSARRIYTCLYCGNEIVRHESYDGQFSIKNVARQALVAVAERDLADAEEHLVECAKIDPGYVGSVVANLAYNVVALSMSDNAERSRRLTAQVAEYHSRLTKTPLFPGSDEELFYQGLDSADVLGLLALVYDALGDEAREQFVVGCVNPAGVRSASAAKDLVGYALQESAYAMVDELLDSSAELDGEFVLAQLLSRYPDGEKKVENVGQVAARVTDKESARALLCDYLSSNTDSFATVFGVTRACAAAGIYPSVALCLDALVPRCPDVDHAGAVFDMAVSGGMTDEDVADYIACCASRLGAEFAVAGLTRLSSSGRYASVAQGDVVSALCRTDIDVDGKLSILRALYAFPHKEQFRHAVLSAFLRVPTAHPDRPAIVAALADTVTELNPAAVEDYLTHFSADGADKAKIAEVLFAKSAGSGVLKRAASGYVAHSPDSPEVTESILRLMAAQGLTEGVDVAAGLCASGDAARALHAARAMKAAGWRPTTRSLDTYLLACTKGMPYSSELAGELFVDDSTISPGAFSTYLLHLSEPAAGRVEWTRSLAARTTGGPVEAIRCRVLHEGRTVDCSLIQAYLLTSPDVDANTRSILSVLADGPQHLGAMVMVTDSTGTSTYKFKRYINANKASLSAAVQEYCTTHKLIGGLF